MGLVYFENDSCLVRRKMKKLTPKKGNYIATYDYFGVSCHIWCS